MKKFIKFLSMFLLICTLVSVLGACDLFKPKTTTSGEEELEWVDYASQLKLDMDTPTLKWEVTVKMFI